MSKYFMTFSPDYLKYSLVVEIVSNSNPGGSTGLLVPYLRCSSDVDFLFFLCFCDFRQPVSTRKLGGKVAARVHQLSQT